MPYKDKNKQREYQRTRVSNTRSKFFSGKSCVECGSIENLELDHINRATKVSHKVWTWTENRRAEELSKCQILCHDCHLNKTITENKGLAKPLTHGTDRSYHYYKCRCFGCKQAHRDLCLAPRVRLVIKHP